MFESAERHGDWAVALSMRGGSGARAEQAVAPLALACERALSRAARSHGAGTRQQVRAAARRFVRRHRRDAGYLGWVLRSVGACSALAVALLGLSAAPASAELVPFAGADGRGQPARWAGT